jgi:hypothetical protein
MHSRGIVAGSALLVLLGSFSCNLFAPTSANRHPDDYGPQSDVVEGKIKMRDGNWLAAISLFDKALSEDSSLSEAYFYKGKCLLRVSHVDLSQVWGEINPKREDSLAVPFLFRPGTGVNINQPPANGYLAYDFIPGDTAWTIIDSVFLERKRVYDAICRAITMLDYINRNSGRLDGAIRRDQYESDYLVEISVKTVLGIIDLNNNDTLDFNAQERKAFRILCEDIPTLNPDSMTLESLKAISNNPDDINSTLDIVRASLNSTDTSYNNFQAELIQGAKTNPQLNTNMASGISKMISGFKDILPFYYYNDSTDNDSDWYDSDSNGIADRMVWVDWDFDSLIDVNPPGVLPHVHIGEAADKATRHQYYAPVDAPGAKYHRYRYIGPYTYEFIGGDWGIDEEVMDGKDNDFDGIIDEDTRITSDSTYRDPLACYLPGGAGTGCRYTSWLFEILSVSRPPESARRTIIGALVANGISDTTAGHFVPGTW